ncbi:Peptidoglycan-binding domain 1 protein (plasmid) [Herpetosiphon aurantiacus DSM 785]|uniref:Peptidoglycan-binding domain 1 protein n=1 Tax=Herpetosiphon aurantiacus (strain ATCC 23779 / DSM 785 / 114-95) TaxID=316274 RepID=A9B907_HERA2|nr:Peptidoglycan-binding domain 1 protein [Herpetosiphon aurantiacus DSM 785]
MHTFVRRSFIFLLLVGFLVSSQSSAHAIAGAFFHTLSKGNRGTDVKALQYLLAIDADGVFGDATVTAVKRFQGRKGLTADGIVGPATWDALTETVRPGDSGNAVKAIQTELNAKHKAGLTVDGKFGAGTEQAVKQFQRHVGITADGIVGSTTWKQLIWHYEYADMSANMCDQDPDGNGSANWGVAATIAQLEAATRDFAATGNGKVPLGDISFEHGGDIPGHGSHETGLDVDVWPIRTDTRQCTGARITWRSSTYDRAATRTLVKAIRAAAPGQIALIYFNDPVLIDEGLTSAYPNHDNHLHIRYK